MTDLVARLVSLLEENKMSGVQLGKILGKQKSPVTDWKNGQSKPTLEQIVLICEYFAISSDYLLFGIPIERTNQANCMSKDERFLLKYYAQLDEDDQAEVLKDVAARAQLSGAPDTGTTIVGQEQASISTNQSESPSLSQPRDVPKPEKKRQKRAQ